jgi:hypothetical protein
MGIKHLNRFLRENCKKTSIYKAHLGEFKNKTLVIDASIYLYKFVSENGLIENMYLFISILKSYNIHPIFVFDGKPPAEKKELLQRRRLEKREAEDKYNQLQQSMSGLTPQEKQEAEAELEKLKKQFVRITDIDIQRTKELLDAYGIIYLESPGEADQLCAYLLKSGRAWGCMSDDMDMFLYGCPYVLRSLSLLNHTVVFYDTKSIFEDLELTEQEFREIMVLSGTDYNIHSKTSLTDTIKWYYQYNVYRMSATKSPPLKFYVWLMKHTQYITNFVELLRTYQMFHVLPKKEFEIYDVMDLFSKPVNRQKLEQILQVEGFVFSDLSYAAPKTSMCPRRLT